MINKIKKDAVITTEHLVKDYGPARVVNDVSVTVKAGEIVGLLGPNGAGKTTTFKMLVGFTQPTQGKIFFDGNEMTNMPIHMRARLGISYLPQETSVFRKMTVRENLMAVLQAQGHAKAEIRPLVDQLVEELGLGYVERRLAEKLSGGEKRRVEIARALMTGPTFIFLDEPFTGIDPKTVEDIQKIIQNLRNKGLGVLITDHNVRETLNITDRSYMLHSGVVLVSGTVSEVLANSSVRDKYLTQSIVEDLSRINKP
ncbi:MAG TPA: LPS export ABC transporter ATP-binding protein [Candidatus Sumerlaeota bacterium]|nr:LPS export ABC transporter ATP-binding protein [Candidatus Sumerlaeota bacterium]HMZ51171.1 LPS export ABC transporter ATP-binding protein [Candidatus Sumerlaeota bacterium]HNM46498.1 LPS export ABC transporter ATP-binding protein [Candidatus Sumerlaeota bacterium]